MNGRNAARAVATLNALLLTACGGGSGGADAGPDAANGRWQCPAEWVAYARGGCGPAVLLCVPDGGAANGACDGTDFTRPHAVSDGDGGTVQGFYRAPDGAIRGAWHEPGEPGGPPRDDSPPSGGTGTTLQQWSPAVPDLACPAGWSRQPDGTCDPALPTACPSGAEPLPADGCTATAEVDCPATEYADPGTAASGATVVHARPDAEPSVADGSAARPFATLAAATAAAGPGGWVLLAAGQYTELPSVTASVHLIGQCAAHVTLRGPNAGAALEVAGIGGELDLRGVHIAGNAVRARDGAHLVLQRVRITGTDEAALSAIGSGTRLEATDVVVADTNSGGGVAADAGATVTATRLAVARVHGLGVVASRSATTLSLSDASVRGTAAGTVGQAGRGLVVMAGASLRAARTAIADNAEVGAGAYGSGSRLEITDGVVTGTRALSDGTAGRGLHSQDGATVAAARVLVDANAEAGALASGAQSTLTLTDAIVRGTRPHPNGRFGRGLAVQNRGALAATRVLLEANTEFGAWASGAESRLTLVDVVVRATRPRADGTSGLGLTAGLGARLTAARVLLADNAECGVLASDPGTHVELTDAVVRATRPRSSGEAGYGVAVQGGATLSGLRLRVTDNAEAGVTVSGASTQAELADGVILATRPRPNAGGGHGLQAQTGARVLAERLLVAESTEAGVSASGTDTELELDDSVVRTTHPIADGTLGQGVQATDGGTLIATRVLITDSAEDGALAGGPGAMLRLVDVAVRATRGDRDGFIGNGMVAGPGATLSATRLLVDDNLEFGAIAFGAGARMDLTDALVVGVHSSSRGVGIGVGAYGGAHGVHARLAVTDVAGAGVVASVIPGEQLLGTSDVDITDLFVRGVAPSPVEVRAPDRTSRDVAYGLHAGFGCRLAANRAVVDGAQLGVFDAGGALEVHSGAIVHQSVAAASRSSLGRESDLVLDDVLFADNVRDAVLIDDSYPTAAFEIPDTCRMPPCP